MLPMLLIMSSLLPATFIAASACASGNAHPSHHPIIHSVSLHSLQSIPITAFPKYPMTKRSVPYDVSSSSELCSFALHMHPSPFPGVPDTEPLSVVPPSTGFPRASATSGGAQCSDLTDLCAQAFQVTLQVTVALETAKEEMYSDMPASTLPYLHLLYSDLTASQTPPAAHTATAAPRPLSPRDDPFAANAPLQLIAYSVSVTVPHCSLLSAHLQLLQVICLVCLRAALICRSHCCS